MDNQIMRFKHELILKYVTPILEIILPKDESLIQELLVHSRLHSVIKYQLIETPGVWKDGNMWFSIDALMHSYYICPDTQVNCGRQIWKKQQFIFDNQNFYDQLYRSDYIQAVEPGTIISISYSALNWLQEHFVSIKQQLIQLSRIQQQYYRNHAQLLIRSPLEKVKAFTTTHKLFSSVANNTINGMHTGLSRQGYENQLKKLQ